MTVLHLHGWSFFGCHGQQEWVVARCLYLVAWPPWAWAELRHTMTTSEMWAIDDAVDLYNDYFKPIPTHHEVYLTSLPESKPLFLLIMNDVKENDHYFKADEGLLWTTVCTAALRMLAYIW